MPDNKGVLLREILHLMDKGMSVNYEDTTDLRFYFNERGEDGIETWTALISVKELFDLLAEKGVLRGKEGKTRQIQLF